MPAVCLHPACTQQLKSKATPYNQRTNLVVLVLSILIVGISLIHISFRDFQKVAIDRKAGNVDIEPIDVLLRALIPC